MTDLSQRARVAAWARIELLAKLARRRCADLASYAADRRWLAEHGQPWPTITRRPQR